jgi:hypothetical protein
MRRKLASAAWFPLEADSSLAIAIWLNEYNKIERYVTKPLTPTTTLRDESEHHMNSWGHATSS